MLRATFPQVCGFLGLIYLGQYLLLRLHLRDAL